MDELDNFMKGHLTFSRKQFDDSLMYFRAVLEDTPNDPEAWYNVGVALVQLESYDSALHHFDMALEINPNDDFISNARLEAKRKYYEQRFNLKI